MDVDALRALQASLNAGIERLISASEAGDQHAQFKATENVHEAAVSLERLTVNPAAEVYRLGLQPTVNTAIRIAIDLDLFEIIKHEEHLQDLVQRTGAEERLLIRIMRLLVAVKIFDEPKQGVYTCTPLSKAITTPGLRDWLKMCFDSILPIWQEAPSFIKSNSFKDITDLTNNPSIKLYGANFFDNLAKHPQREADFASAMALGDNQPPNRMPQYPYDEAAFEMQSTTTASSKDDSVFIVDIGGGHGHYLKRLQQNHPYLPGRKILQDLPSTLSSIAPDPAFETMPYDFFTPQPVQHAKFYHLRQILHDWPDTACVQILSQIRPAMKPGFSKLLINTFVLRTYPVSAREAMLDLTMWINCGMERDETQWHELLSNAGFRIMKIVRAESGPMSMIEVVRDDEDGEELSVQKSKL